MDSLKEIMGDTDKRMVVIKDITGRVRSCYAADKRRRNCKEKRVKIPRAMPSE